MNKLSRFFAIEEKGTSFQIEVIAGLTTFMTMAYVLVTQPGAICGFGPDAYIVDCNGVMITKEAIMVTCAFISAIITILMGLYANLPFALSTGMGSNFMFGALIQSGAMSYGACMAITLISGIIFVILTKLGIRDLIVKAMPKNLKVAIGVAIGFFIAYLGFKNSGIGTFVNGIGQGNFKDPSVYLAIFGLFLIGFLNAYKVKGSIMIGIVVVTLLGIPLGVTTLPATLAKLPDMAGLQNIVFNFDFKSILTFSCIPLIFITFCGDFFSTLGTVLGCGAKAGMLDKDGNFEHIEKPFLVDAIGTVVGACTGNTTITTYVESGAGVQAGGRTGVTAITVAVCFLLSMFFSPLVLIIPNAATGPALIFVGFLMIEGISQIEFSKFDEAFGPFIMIMFTIFTGSIASGICAGIIAHVFIKVACGKAKEVNLILYVLLIPLVLYFIAG